MSNEDLPIKGWPGPRSSPGSHIIYADLVAQMRAWKSGEASWSYRQRDLWDEQALVELARMRTLRDDRDEAIRRMVAAEAERNPSSIRVAETSSLRARVAELEAAAVRSWQALDSAPPPHWITQELRTAIVEGTCGLRPWENRAAMSEETT